MKRVEFLKDVYPFEKGMFRIIKDNICKFGYIDKNLSVAEIDIKKHEKLKNLKVICLNENRNSKI